MVYHLDSLNGSKESLVMDGKTLADVWMGKIWRWNDPAIAALNPTMNLPAGNITLIASPNNPSGPTEVVKRALASFSDEFKSALAKAGNQFQNMLPAQEGRMVLSSDSDYKELYLKVT